MSQVVEMSLARIDSPPRGERSLGERFAATPRLACETLARAMAAGDLDAAMSCFAPDACLIAADGAHIHGEVAIRARLTQLVQAGMQLAIEPAGVVIAGDLALAQPALALRRVGEEWRIAIVAPWGWDPAPPLEAIGFTQ